MQKQSSRKYDARKLQRRHSKCNMKPIKLFNEFLQTQQVV